MLCKVWRSKGSKSGELIYTITGVSLNGGHDSRKVYKIRIMIRFPCRGKRKALLEEKDKWDVSRSWEIGRFIREGE